MIRVKCNMLVSFCHEEMLSLSFNSQEERPPTLGCQQLFVQYSRSYRSFQRGCLLHPQPEDGSHWGLSGNLEFLSRCAQNTVWPTYTFYVSQRSLFQPHLKKCKNCWTPECKGTTVVQKSVTTWPWCDTASHHSIRNPITMLAQSACICWHLNRICHHCNMEHGSCIA